MAGQKKWGKDGYLQNFEKSREGGYVYTGELWQADKEERRRTLTRLWLLCAGQLLAVILPGIFTTAGFSGTFYVILPYVFWLLCNGYLAYLLGNITFGGNPMRDYVYERSVARYVPCAGAAAFGAALMALGLFIFLIKGGTGQGSMLCFACCLLQGVSFLLIKKWKITEIWGKMQEVNI